MSKRYARFLVFITSGAVLVLEILAGRLMAPYVGVSLETFTGIIGTILAGIALGSALGGLLADRHDPDRLIGPSLIGGGILAWFSIPVVGFLGPGVGGSVAGIIILALFGFFAPAMVLSAVGPLVAKLRLHSLDETGEVVGGLSAAGTVGALFGTFITGFVLVSAAPTRPVIIGLGVGLVVLGVVHLVRRGDRVTTTAGAVGIIMFALAVASPGPCDFESAYSCGRVVADEDDDSVRYLILDDARHGVVDLDDPTYLGFRYTRIMGDAIEAMTPGPLATLHIGGGAYSLPPYLDAVRPGSSHVVLEIDELLFDVAQEDLGLVPGPNLSVVTGDARLAMVDLGDDSFDLIVGDAFAGLTVPWHLTTTEFVAELDRVLRPGGLYVMNAVDGGENRFVEAQLATLADHFDHQAVVVAPEWPNRGAVNQILVASDQPIPAIIVAPEDGTLIVEPGDLRAFIDQADPLRDDFAPVDQLATNR